MLVYKEIYDEELTCAIMEEEESQDLQGGAICWRPGNCWWFSSSPSLNALEQGEPNGVAPV